MSEIIERAKSFATKAHAHVNQKRKYTGEDYIVHPEEVASMVSSYGGNDSMVAAAWLHDTVEDTNVTQVEIYYHFGSVIGSMVEMLTKITKPEDGNRAFRKVIEAERLSSASNDVKTIKVCDLIDNTKSIVEHDEKFAVTYLKEKDHLLFCLMGANKIAWNDARHQLSACAEKIGIKLRCV